MAYKYKYKGSYEYTECWKKKCWAPKNWCFWNVVLEKTLESPLDCKEIQPVHPKGNQSWISIGRTDAEAEIPVLWPRDAKNWPFRKDPDAGKDWRQEEKGMTEDKMVGWHHWLDGLEFEQAPGVGDGQGGLVCCSPWDCKEFDTTEQLNWTEQEKNGAGHRVDVCNSETRHSASKLTDSHGSWLIYTHYYQCKLLVSWTRKWKRVFAVNTKRLWFIHCYKKKKYNKV